MPVWDKILRASVVGMVASLCGGVSGVGAEESRLAAPTAESVPPAPEAPRWTAKRIYDAFRSESRCVVETAPVTLDDGRQETKLFVRVDGRSLYIVTESNVDLGHADVGIQVDDKKLIKPDQVFLDQQLLFETQIGQIVEQFKNGLAVDVRMRFWPTWPDKGLKTVNFSLVGFTRAFARLPGC